MVRIPPITSVETVIRIYYSNLDLGNQEIKQIFGSIGSARVVALKKIANDLAIERGIKRYNALRVNTRCAYESWGLDIDDLECRYQKLKRFGGL